MRALRPFDYFEPTSVKEAVESLSSYGDRARILAGGIDLIPRLRKREVNADYLINIQRIPGLDQIKENGRTGFRFGAMARLHSLEKSRGLRENYPSLYAAIHQISSVQAKHMGTAVGNLCVATAASDVATVLMTLKAEFRVSGLTQERVVPIEHFYPERKRIALRTGEMVTGVRIPPPTPGLRTAFLNLTRTHADIAKISVAVAVRLEDGLCSEARIAIGAAAPTVFRAVGAENVLTGKAITPEAIDQAAKVAAGETSPITDLRSTADYRKAMTELLVKKALENATRGEVR